MDMFENDSTTENTVMGDNIVPEPKKEAEDVKVEDMEFEADDLINAMQMVDENGHSPSFIVASVDRLKNVSPDKLLDDYAGDDIDNVDQMSVENCAVNISTFDGDLVMLNLTFDTPKDAYMIELNNLLKRYQVLNETMAADDNTDEVPMFSLYVAPHMYKGMGVVRFSFPVFYTRCLNDNGMNTSVLLVFHLDQIGFEKINATEEEMAQLTADVMREMEAGDGGRIYAE